MELTANSGHNTGYGNYLPGLGNTSKASASMLGPIMVIALSYGSNGQNEYLNPGSHRLLNSGTYTYYIITNYHMTLKSFTRSFPLDVYWRANTTAVSVGNSYGSTVNMISLAHTFTYIGETFSIPYRRLFLKRTSDSVFPVVCMSREAGLLDYDISLKATYGDMYTAANTFDAFPFFIPGRTLSEIFIYDASGDVAALVEPSEWAVFDVTYTMYAI